MLGKSSVMLTRLESAQVDQIVSIYSDAQFYYKLSNFVFRCKLFVKQLSGSKLERSSKARVECEYASTGAYK